MVESYKHRFAKQTLLMWLRDAAREAGTDEYVSWEPLQWRVNRSGPMFGVWPEYPVCIDNQNELIGLWPVWDESNWDESETEEWDGDPMSETASLTIHRAAGSVLHVRPPTFEECIERKWLPVVIFDIAIQHKGGISYAIEVVHRHGVTDVKSDYLKRIAFSTCMQIFTIDADWILSQVQRPKRLNMTRWMPMRDAG